jgi:hypothetical protein
MTRTMTRHHLGRVVVSACLLALAMGSPQLASAARGTAPGQVTASMRVRAIGSSAARVDWTLAPGTVTVQVLRDGLLLDEFPASSALRYTDRLLWQSTAYTYGVRMLDGAGGSLADLSAPVTTPAQTGNFPRLYAKTSFWNRRVPQNPPIDVNSAAIVAASIVPTAGIAKFNNSDEWGVPIAYADPASTSYVVGCLYYGCSTEVVFRIPRYAKNNTGSDGKLVVVDPSIDTELDMGKADYDPIEDTWTSGSRYTTASNGWGAMCPLHDHCDGVLMSGMDQFGGVVRPEEIAQGHIDHALALIVPYWRLGFIACPAVKTVGGFDDPDAIPIGAKIQLDPAFDVNGQSWPQWQKVIATALQLYGAYVWDAGSDRLDIRGESNIARGYDAWAKVGVPSVNGQASLSALPWDQVRVLKITEC